MDRNYCVFVLEACYSVASGKVSIEYTNYRDLDGDETDVNHFKDLYENKIKGSFKT
jgi:hypothetical protein